MFYSFSGLAITGLEDPLIVGGPTSLFCFSNVVLSSIEWKDQSGIVLANATNQQQLHLIIFLVTDVLQVAVYTCSGRGVGEVSLEET